MHRIYESDRNRFKELIEELQSKTIESSLREMKPLMWRKFIVRLLCTSKGEHGRELRNLWVKIYKGDLEWGVRDARRKFKEKNLGHKRGNDDRNSWIVKCIRGSLKNDLNRRN